VKVRDVRNVRKKKRVFETLLEKTKKNEGQIRF